MGFFKPGGLGCFLLFVHFLSQTSPSQAFISSWLISCNISSWSRCNISFSACCWQVFHPSKSFITRCLQLQRNSSFQTAFCIFRLLRLSILTEQQKEKSWDKSAVFYLLQYTWYMTNAPYLFSASWVCAEQTSWQSACVSQTLLVQNKTSWTFTLHFRCTKSWGSTSVKYRAHWVNKRAHLCPSLPLFLSLFSLFFKMLWLLLLF